MEICSRKYCILIKTLCYLVIMAITNFVQVEFNRAIQELFDIKFIDFGEGSVIVFILVKTQAFPMGIIECSFLKSKALKKCVFVIVLYLTLI